MVTYLYDAAGSVSLTLRGGLGSDTLKITGGPGTDTPAIYRYAITHVGPGTAGSAGYYLITAPRTDGSFETIAVDGGAGTGQMAALANGPGAGDYFTAFSSTRSGSMVGTGAGNVYNNSVKNFDSIYAYAVGGGTNATAALGDSNGNDLYVAQTEGTNAYSVMRRLSGGTGPAAYLWAGAGFANIYGYSTNGGTDEAVLFGSSGNDSSALQPQIQRANIAKGGGGFFAYAQGFPKVTVYAGAGTSDIAYLQGTTLDDTFTGTAGMAQMTGTIPATGKAYVYTAKDNTLTGDRWDYVYAQANASPGGVDKAYLNGTTGNDMLIAVGKPHASVLGAVPGVLVAAGNAELSGTNYWIQAQGFQQVYADMKTGNDTAKLYDSTGAGSRTVLGREEGARHGAERRGAERRDVGFRQRQPRSPPSATTSGSPVWTAA